MSKVSSTSTPSPAGRGGYVSLLTFALSVCIAGVASFAAYQSFLANTAAISAGEAAKYSPQGDASFAGIYQLAEDPDKIHFLESMKKMGIVVPSDWECQSQATTGVYPCPNGDPSECRFRHNSDLSDQGHCVYHYCTVDARGASDSCCSYVDGTIGSDIGSTSYSSGTYATFAAGSGAAATCSVTNDYLATYYWHKQWDLDDAVDSYGDRIVTSAYINFDIIRLEFSNQYGLSLYSNSADTIRIFRDTTSADCTVDIPPDSCYSAYFKPIASSTLISIKPNNTFEATATAASARRNRRLSAPKLSTKGPMRVIDDDRMNREARFRDSCDSRKSGCEQSARTIMDAKDDTPEELEPTRRVLRGRGRGGARLRTSGSYSFISSANRAGND